MLKRFIKKYIILVIIGAIISLPILYFIDNYEFKVQNVVSNAAAPTKTEKDKQEGFQLPDGAKCLSFDSDNKNFIYVLYGRLTVRNLSSGNEKTVDETDPVVYQIPMASNHIAYVTNKKGNLVLKDYDIDSDKSQTVGKFYEKNFSGVKDMRYADNYYYVTTENNGNDANQPDAVYKIKSLKNSQLYIKSSKIYAFYVSNDGDFTAYEDKSNFIYINKNMVSFNKSRKFTLLGVDSDSNFYLNSKDDTNKVFVVKNGKVKDTITLDDDKYDKPYSDKGHIYLAYSNYFYDVVDKKKYEMPKGATLVNISNGNAIYKGSDNKITTKSIQ